MGGVMQAPSPTSVIKRTGEIVAFDRRRINTAIYKAGAAIGEHDMPRAERLTEEVVALLTEAGGTPSVEEIQDLIEEKLIEHRFSRLAKAYILYREERARLRLQRREGTTRSESTPWKIMWQTLLWNVDHHCLSITELNDHIRQGTFGSLVRAAEEAYESSCRLAAEAVLERRDRVRVVIVAGPSSSGKTTTTTKLAQRLQEENLQVVPLNLDNYFFDLHLHPRDETGDYDFETPEALDLELINQHLELLLAGQSIDMPVYDFKQGRRLEERRPMRLADDQILLLDTLHGLYAPLTQSVDNARKFRLYIETVPQLRDADGHWMRWTDLRLLRRMMRDAAHRGYDPARTVSHWHFVRRGELKHIIPYLGTSDFIVNGALPYELPIFRHHLGNCFDEFVSRWQGDAHHTDALHRSRRLAALLDQVEASPDAAVPPTSVLREFIGGSAYDVHRA
jgi:uridine kinase